MIKVYRNTWRGRKLVGWVDENGTTYKAAKWPSRPQRIKWSSDERGRIYMDFEDLHALVGWLGKAGRVYVQPEHPYTYEVYGYYEWGIPDERRPALAFWVRIDGTVYGRGASGTKMVGTIEGTSELLTMAGLALVVLL